MPDNGPEAAAHVHAQALVDANIGTAFLGMTPEGLASAMEVGNTTWNILSYELGEGRFHGGDFVIDITFYTDLGRDTLHYRFQNVDGGWKVASVAPAD